jgi:putative membrane protein
MHAGRHYTPSEVFFWTLSATLLFLAIATVPTVAWTVFGQTWLTIPWQPIALVGTAVAFTTGFKNNAAYGRLWEARQIWGSIINLSRSWAVQVLDLPTSAAEAKRALVVRHLAWITALRFQLREHRAWETMAPVARKDGVAGGGNFFWTVPEWQSDVLRELEALVGPDELARVKDKKNRATHLLAAQSRELAGLAAKGELTDLRFVELHRTVTGLYDCQGRCERIKNFPYPRQYATLNTYFNGILVATVPFALMPELAKLGPHFVWATIPLAALVSWIFHMIDKIGQASENPFEGGPNDVPITAMSRTIEIDLRELLGEPPPEPMKPSNNVLM